MQRYCLKKGVICIAYMDYLLAAVWHTFTPVMWFNVATHLQDTIHHFVILHIALLEVIEASLLTPLFVALWRLTKHWWLGSRSKQDESFVKMNFFSAGVKLQHIGTHRNSLCLIRWTGVVMLLRTHCVCICVRVCKFNQVLYSMGFHISWVSDDSDGIDDPEDL